MQMHDNLASYDELCYITLHYITLHYITLHYITLHYITLHFADDIHERLSLKNNWFK